VAGLIKGGEGPKGPGVRAQHVEGKGNKARLTGGAPQHRETERKKSGFNDSLWEGTRTL